MSFDERARIPPRNSGPFIAVIVNHNDPLKMGRLEVSLIQGLQNDPSISGETYIAKYLSPFSGATSVEYEGSDAKNFNDVQKSYGFWMIPPDIGSRVMVIFAQEDPNQCYWMGSVQDTYQNYMIPGIASSQNSNMTAAQQKKYGTSNVPVAEYNKKTELLKDPRIDQKPKPVHPFADALLRQGLLMDTIRGVTSSSARRETPSQVYGISTPGPLDNSASAPKKQIGPNKNAVAPVSRLGGTTFVMDDGYTDANGNLSNELVRIRTRTGHQILLHNTADLIYIGNAAGSAWIELTSQGKIDVYAQDSVSIHTGGDFNLRAERDFNLEAGRNFNIATNVGDGASVAGNININSSGNINQIGTNIYNTAVGDFNLYTGNNLNVDVVSNFGLAAGGNSNILATGVSSLSAGGQFNISSGSQSPVAITGGTNLSLTANKSVTIGNGSTLINMNSASPTIATPAQAPTVTKARGLGQFAIDVKTTSTGWSNSQFYNSSGKLLSIMQRVPMHEPWDQHENINPSQFTITNTDATAEPSVRTSNGNVTPGATNTTNTPYPAQSGPGVDKGTVRGQRFPWSTDQPFLTAVKTVSEGFNFDPLDLLGAMWNETGGTYDPAIKNPLGSATGLIQFLESTAKGLGTTTAALAQMTRPEQMQYVKKFFQQFGWPSAQVPKPTIANVYVTIFYPAFRFKGPNDVIATNNPSDPNYKIYIQNKSLDQTGSGSITPSSVAYTASLRRISVVNVLKAAGVGIVKGEPNYFIVPSSTTPNAGTPLRSSDGTIVTDSSGNPITTAPLSTSITGR